jgi:hypothetical protein
MSRQVPITDTWMGEDFFHQVRFACGTASIADMGCKHFSGETADFKTQTHRMRRSGQNASYIAVTVLR